MTPLEQAIALLREYVDTLRHDHGGDHHEAECPYCVLYAKYDAFLSTSQQGGAGEVEKLRAALHECAELAEALKSPCGDDPESAQAIRNGQYANISHTAHIALGTIMGPSPPSVDAIRAAWSDALAPGSTISRKMSREEFLSWIDMRAREIDRGAGTQKKLFTADALPVVTNTVVAEEIAAQFERWLPTLCDKHLRANFVRWIAALRARDGTNTPRK